MTRKTVRKNVYREEKAHFSFWISNIISFCDAIWPRDADCCELLLSTTTLDCIEISNAGNKITKPPKTQT